LRGVLKALLGTAILLGAGFSPDVSGVQAWPRVVSRAWAGEGTCRPTARDAEGPFYKPNAPERASLGRGLVVTGIVRTAGSCAPVPRARIEWWQASPQGQYDDAHRAAQTADREGKFRFETNVPGIYPGRPPHLHVKVSAPGHRPLTTQLYPTPGQTELAFDFVLDFINPYRVLPDTDRPR
jgi:protocatechuate 3,4-dioxygenase beta subunit